MRMFRICKLVNAFVPKAIPSEPLSDNLFSAVTRYVKKHGGLWVGGAVEITHEGVSFKPNALNDAFHVGLEPVQIPLASIGSVRREFGWLTGIIVIEHSVGRFRFRCFGAKRVVSRFRSYLLRRNLSGLEPESSHTVTCDEDGVCYARPDGSSERISWRDLILVSVRTTDQGPFEPDVFWDLCTSTTKCSISQGATGEKDLLTRLQSLPGFDNETLIEAMGSTENQEFVCWRRQQKKKG